MKVLGINRRSYNWNLKGYQQTREKVSSYHLRARELLTLIFPSELRLEEVFIPGCGTLYFDFFLPSRRLAIEVHGEQHYSFNAFHHKHKLDFFKSRQRDEKKRDFCDLNQISLVELRYSETDDEWRRQIESY